MSALEDPVVAAVLDAPAPVAPVLRAVWGACAAALSIAPRHGLDRANLEADIGRLLHCRPALVNEVLHAAVELGRADLDEDNRIHPPAHY